MAKAAQISFKDFRTRFATEAACRKYMFEVRFPNGYVCPECGCRKYSPMQKLPPSDFSYRWNGDAPDALTIYRLFWAIYLCATDKRGISAKGLARQLDLSYESAWYLLVRIRSAMQERDHDYLLQGIIEMDEAYLRAPQSGKRRGRGTEREKMVVAVSKETKNRPMFLRLKIIPNITTLQLGTSSPFCLKPIMGAAETINHIWMSSVFDSTGDSFLVNYLPDSPRRWLHLVLC